MSVFSKKNLVVPALNKTFGSLEAVFQPENFTGGLKWPLKTFFRGQFFRIGANKLKATEGNMHQGTKENRAVY